MKKILALALAAILLLTMGTMAVAEGALAATTGSITISNPVTDPNANTTTYEAYRIFDMTSDGNMNASGSYTAVAYTINSAWTGFFAEGAPGAEYIVAANNADSTLTSITVGDETKYINITDANVQAFAKAAFEYAQTKPVAATVESAFENGATEVKFENLALGYYMVYPKGASVQIGSNTSIVSITNTAPNGQIEQKAKYPTMTKTADDISVEVGQKVNFTLTSNVPDTTGYSKYEYTFSDTMSAGLTFDASSVVVKIGDQQLAASDYVLTETDSGFSVAINLLKAKEGADPAEYEAKYTYNAPVTVTYSATVNEGAVAKIENNSATLTYHNDPKNEKSTETTPPVEKKVFSAQIVIDKVDGTNAETKLAGAQFILRCKTPATAAGGEKNTAVQNKYYKYTAAAEGTAAKTEWVENQANATIITTNENGAASFAGLENGTYELIEVAAPEGYNLLTGTIEVEVKGNDQDVNSLTYAKQIANNAGTLLPSTGGVGTTLFYVLGGMLAVAAAVLLVTRKRMGAME